MASSSVDNSNTEEEKEQHGPKVGIHISFDQADLVIQRHFPTRRATSISHINRGYNNRVYIVTTLNKDKKAEGEVNEYILRLTGGNYTRYKTENELCAILHLAKQLPSLPIPKIYGYCTDRDKSGINQEYILMEKLKGVPLDHVWDELNLQNKMGIVDQLAKIFAPMIKMKFAQIGSFHLASESIGNSFGMGIDPQRDIIGGEDDILKIGERDGLEVDGEPYNTFLDFFSSSCESELNALRSCKFMMGGEGYEERLKRIEKFVQAFKTIESVPVSFPKEALTNVPFTFCHGDLEPRNMMVDKESLEVTGLLDFEYAGAYPLDYGWFCEFSFVDADTTDWRVFKEERPRGDHDHEPDKGKEEEINSLREYFYKAMRKNEVPVPDDIPGHLARSELYFFQRHISPWWLKDERDPELESCFGGREHAGKRVDAVLDKYGF